VQGAVQEEEKVMRVTFKLLYGASLYS
jgi:hypothetical protein